MDYAELYEILRKEKYADSLQTLPKGFVDDFSFYLKEKRTMFTNSTDLFSDDLLKSKKQFENALSIFKELMRIRKRKILNLVFVASETGIMKRDFSTMLNFEQGLFERLVLAVEDADRELQQQLHGDRTVLVDNKLVLVRQPIAEFVDMNGSVVGPFETGSLVNLDSKVADILLSEQKVALVD